LRANEDDETAIFNGSQAAQILEGTWPASETAAEERLIDAAASEVPRTRDGAEVELPGASVQGNEPQSAAARAQRAPTVEARPAKSEGGNGPSVEQVISAVAEFGIDGARYGAYAAKRWGPGWKINADGRRRALAEIERFRDDPDGLTNKIDAEIDEFA
jgi:hypothetical protein